MRTVAIASGILGSALLVWGMRNEGRDSGSSL